MVDSSEAVAVLEGSRAAVDVWIKVDCGYHRCGVDPSGDVAIRLAERIGGKRAQQAKPREPHGNTRIPQLIDCCLRLGRERAHHHEDDVGVIASIGIDWIVPATEHRLELGARVTVHIDATQGR